MGDIFKASVLVIFVSSVVWLTLYGYKTLQTMMDNLMDSTYGSSALILQGNSSKLSDDTQQVRQEYYRISRQH